MWGDRRRRRSLGVRTKVAAVAVALVFLAAGNAYSAPSATRAPRQAVAIPTPDPVEALPEESDHREYMHGVDMVKVNGRHLLFFSANNYPPTQPTGDWQNDIYYSVINPADPNRSFSPKPLVTARLAQEPVSAAVNSAGNIALTSEDAQFSEQLDQTFGIWGPTLRPKVPYGRKLMPPQGGHSGHVAASGRKFLVSFSDGWIQGGGVDNLGTGDDVFGRIFDETGALGPMIETSVGESRDWWPVVAGSPSNWLQVWQRYGTAGDGGGSVVGAIIDGNGRKGPEIELFANNKYYFHDVQYMPALKLYLVVGSQNKAANAGVAVLVDLRGRVVARKTNLPNSVREGATVVNGSVAVYPTADTGAAVLDVTQRSIALRQVIPSKWRWDYMGTDGYFASPSQVVFATGSQDGIKFVPFRLAARPTVAR